MDLSNFIISSEQIIICLFILFIFHLCVCFAIIRISQHLKDYVDLQYKIYKEVHNVEKDTISSYSRSNRPE